ncbi:alpha mannosidase-like protein [Dissophora globulifera]|nr:alpha mannosidase-like protein [Dissophora globulifera]
MAEPSPKPHSDSRTSHPASANDESYSDFSGSLIASSSSPYTDKDEPFKEDMDSDSSQDSAVVENFAEKVAREAGLRRSARLHSRLSGQQSQLKQHRSSSTATPYDTSNRHTRSSSESSALAAAAGGAGAAAAAAPGNGVIRPWIILLIFSVIQVIFSSSLPSNGVNASSSSPGSDSTSNSGGSGNSASNRAGATEGVYNRQYHRVLAPITDPTKSPGKIVTERMTETRRLLLRKEAKDMFLHGYHGYLNHAFPKDELNPVACTGRGPDRQNPNNINVNDVLGDFSLTLIDALDTLAVMREPELFRQAIQLVKRHVYNFDINSRVQVFEVNIRVLGALLSAHQFASDPQYKSVVKGYKGELLTLAEDLGKRLMKAFKNTPTGIPWPRVNLRRGVLPEESSETCVAGAGSLLLEFGVLSRLTGDKSYEEAARTALMELWSRRSKIGLMGNTINITSGQWMSAMTGIGAGTDSFYEYLLKSYVLFGDEEYLDMYETSQEAIKRNLLHDSQYFYKHVHLQDGSLLAHWVDSLSAFMPGVQVLGGDLESAIKNHLYYYNIWRKYQAIPERFDFVQQTVAISNYPLRPEFIESNYFLYRATKDPFYLQVGEMVLRDLQAYTKTKCGWASLQSVIDKNFEDRMESFALSETIKYLYLLFDEENLLHHELKDSNFVFTTEGHILSLAPKYLTRPSIERRKQQQPLQQFNKNSLSEAIRNHGDGSNSRAASETTAKTTTTTTITTAGPVCKPYYGPATFLKSIPYRPDADFARQMVGTREDFRDLLELDPKGYCEKPTLEVEKVIVEFVGPPKKTVFDDVEDSEIDGNAASSKTKSQSAPPKDLMVIPITKGVFVNRIVGVKMQIQYDGLQNGYRAVKVADYPLSLNCNVYIEQSSMQPLWDSFQRAQAAHLRLFKPSTSHSSSSTISGGVVERNLLVTPADFGYWRPRVLDYNPSSTSQESRDNSKQQQPLVGAPFTSDAQARRKHLNAKRLVRIHSNERGCRPYTTAQSNQIRDKMLVVDRGGCLFILKAYYAQVAGAHSIVVINSDNEAFQMTGAGPSPSSAATSEASTRSGGGSTSTNGYQDFGDGIKDDDIDIHSVMMGRSDGELLLEWIRQDEVEEQENEAEKKRKGNRTASSDASTKDDGDDELESYLAAGFVQRRVSKEQMANTRLSYNDLPIVNVFPISVPAPTTTAL